jgi:hypothetical protein
MCWVPLQVPCGQGILGARLFEAKERRDHIYHQRGPLGGLCTARKGSFHSRYVRANFRSVFSPPWLDSPSRSRRRATLTFEGYKT